MKILISLIYFLLASPTEKSISTSDGGTLKYYNIECSKIGRYYNRPKSYGKNLSVYTT